MRPVQTLLIDNYDSYTFNLYQLVASITGTEPIVVRNDDGRGWAKLATLPFDNVVLSPGPGRPTRRADFGLCSEVIANAQVPLLGVCLGHQGIAVACGSSVEHAREIMHGRTSRIFHDGSALFAGVPQGFEAVRYHSLVVCPPLPEELAPVAWTADGVLMALRHRHRPLWGVQFHPESICTEHGETMLRNFCHLTRRFRARLGSATGRRSPRTQSQRSPRTQSQRSLPTLATERRAVTLRVERLAFWRDPASVFDRLFGGAKHAVWLDSSSVRPGLSRFSYMGVPDGPFGHTLTYDVASRTVSEADGRRRRHLQVDVFSFLQSRLTGWQLKRPSPPFDFHGGYVGVFGYEAKADCGSQSVHRADTPDALFAFIGQFLVFDHEQGAVYLAALDPTGDDAGVSTWLDRMRHKVSLCEPSPSSPGPIPAASRGVQSCRWTAAEYLDAIGTCKGALYEGESYEICLTTQFSVNDSQDRLRLYRTLRAINPSPFGAFIRFGDVCMLSSSPERFLKIDGDRIVEAKPIKGTAPRGGTPDDDRARAAELRAGRKTRAENLMIVDLLRNDLGSVCEVGTVHVPTLMTVESYATVHQLVSTVRGRLPDDRHPLEMVRAAFPGGSMTGAPKLRSMQLIDAIEGAPRGLYSGAMGYLGIDARVDLAMVIRTIVATRDTLSVGAGGAIVALSDPQEEYEEMILKAEPLMRAIAVAHPSHGRSRSHEEAALNANQ